MNCALTVLLLGAQRETARVERKTYPVPTEATPGTEARQSQGLRRKGVRSDGGNAAGSGMRSVRSQMASLSKCRSGEVEARNFVGETDALVASRSAICQMQYPGIRSASNTCAEIAQVLIGDRSPALRRTYWHVVICAIQKENRRWGPGAL